MQKLCRTVLTQIDVSELVELVQKKSHEIEWRSSDRTYVALFHKDPSHEGYKSWKDMLREIDRDLNREPYIEPGSAQDIERKFWSALGFWPERE